MGKHLKVDDGGYGDGDVLPRLSEIPENTVGFITGLGFNLNPLEDLPKIEDLASEITTKFAHQLTHLQNLHKRLGSLLVSWGSRSVRAKTSLQDFTLSLENLSLVSSQCGKTKGGRRIEKILANELPCIANELKRVESLRYYAVIALKLEALVGDLEDAVLSTLNQRSGYLFPISGLISSIPGVMTDFLQLTVLSLQDFYAKLDNVHRAVKAINNIEELLLGMLKVHAHWRNLLKAVDMRVDKILGVLRPQVIADHRTVLASLGWPPKLLTSDMQSGEATGIPNPLIVIQGEKKQSYSQSFLALCALQHVQLRREERSHFVLGQKKDETVGLWAIDELVSPIASRIEHHLLKWTDQPEFMFALVYKITRDFIEGVDDVLQPLIDQARLVSCSAKEAWVSAMVQVLSGFLSKKVFPVLAERYRDKHTKSDAFSSWLHLIDHVVRFDKRMQSLITSETYLYLGEVGIHAGVVKSMSVLSSFCERPDWLHIWAKVELKDAWKKLKAELEDERTWSIDMRKGSQKSIEIESEQYCLSTREDHKAPLVAELALKLAWEMIQRCQTLPGTSRQIQFMKSATAKFLWHFLKVLLSRHKSLQFRAYGSDDTLVKACYLINAARYSEFKLREWSDDVDLLELKLSEKGLNFNCKVDATNTDCFFEEEIESLVEMQTNWLMELITHILCEFENLSFYYFHNVDRFEVAPSFNNQITARDMIISDDLAEALDNLRSTLLLTKQHLNANDFLDTWRSVADGLDRFTFHSILSTGNRFSDEGVKQFVADMQGLFSVFQAFCARPEAFFPCIRDFLRLMQLSEEVGMDLKSKLGVFENAKGSECLLSRSISNLSVDQALKILNNRTILV